MVLVVQNMNTYKSKNLELLLSQGYFPRELPPAFTTNEYGKFSHEIMSEWEKSNVFSVKKQGKKSRSSYYYKFKDTEHEIISKPKGNRERRSIHIVHPIAQTLLSYEISSNWKKISKWLSRNKFPLDRLEISNNNSRAISGINFLAHEIKKNYISSLSDWLIQTDITRFYPSIYTHSIPWAAYGKEQVKKNIKRYEGSLADRLDRLVRGCNRNQTVGIPIGAETSRVIAEIISSRIDGDFFSSLDHNISISADRLQDDWFIGSQNLEDAEHILSKIVRSYREYGLEINGSKTSIEHIASQQGVAWKSDLSSFLMAARNRIHQSNIQDFLNLGIRLQQEYKKDQIITYVLSVIEGRKFSNKEIGFLESFLLKSCVIAPQTLNQIAQILIDLNYRTKKISIERIKSRFVSLTEKHIENGNTYELIWILYALRGLKIRFTSKIISSEIENIDSASVSLILMDMKHKGLFAGSLPTKMWEESFTEEKIRSDWTWLLAYESFRQGWLHDHKNLIDGAFLKPLAIRNIKFYNPDKNIKSIRATKKSKLIIRKAQLREAREVFDTMRGFDHWDFLEDNLEEY